MSRKEFLCYHLLGWISEIGLLVVLVLTLKLKVPQHTNLISLFRVLVVHVCFNAHDPSRWRAAFATFVGDGVLFLC